MPELTDADVGRAVAAAFPALEPVESCVPSGTGTVSDLVRIGDGEYEERRKCDGDLMRRITRG